MKTFDDLVLEKLKELGISTQKEWALAMGYKTRNSFWYILKRLVKENKVIEMKESRPYKYKINEGKII